MIREITNYTKYLKENSPWVLKQNLKPTKGLHIFVKLDDNGNPIDFPGEKGKDWDYYDGKNMSEFLDKIIPYEQAIQRIGTSMNKAFDKKKNIVSCSPYSVSFKKEKLENTKLDGDGFEKITKLLPFYFNKALEECFDSDSKEGYKEKVSNFEKFLVNNFNKVQELEAFQEMKKSDFINLYWNIPLEEYKKSHINYLKRNLFNKNDFNSEKEITDETFGLSGFYNGLNSKKTFLEHKTASMYKGITSRIQAKDAVYLNDFEILLKRKIFPNPLPIFIDKKEFYIGKDIIQIFTENGNLTYSQILKALFDKKKDLLLENYYLLFFNYKYEVMDFDFVTKFRYSLEKDGKFPEIINLFELKENNDLKQNRKIKNIFQFETYIVRIIFNNFLVKIDENKNNYFSEINPEYVSGGEPVYLMILKYRRAFYDYIYKSKTQAITCLMWDEIMWNSIIGDLRSDKITEKGYHGKGYSIKEKLNIWFSLYNYFINNERRYDMASKIPQLLDKMKEVANDDSKHFDNVEEFMFGAGQVIYYLLNQSKASEKTHALLEPFLQKVQAEQLQESISQTINTYKHEISFGQGRFERLAAEVLAFETNENIKKYQRLLLAGYFATPVIYEKKQKNEEVNNG